MMTENNWFRFWRGRAISALVFVSVAIASCSNGGSSASDAAVDNSGTDASDMEGTPDDSGITESSDVSDNGDGSDAGMDGCQNASESKTMDCLIENCPRIDISGDTQTGVGTFHGYGDPALMRDPVVSKRVWLVYSWPHIMSGMAPNGDTVLMAAVSTHLARSDDGGESFALVSDLWPEIATTDPEGSGENGLNSSETPSMAWIQSGATAKWYGAHLRYFLRPMTGYNPKYRTSWVVKVGAADSPDLLSNAPEAVLGVSTTASVYQPNVKLDVLAGLPIQRCAMLNNPTLFTQNTTLYLVVECLAFVGTELDLANTTIQVFATSPYGAPDGWTWRYVGRLADASLAQQLGDSTVQQPDLSLAQDGTLIALMTPARKDAAIEVGTLGNGCRALELESIDPPTLRYDCYGQPVVRVSITGSGLGSCTHDPLSESGIVVTTNGGSNAGWILHQTALRP